MENENTTKTPLKLDIASLEDNTELTAWVNFKDLFDLELRFVSKSALQALAKKCSIQKFIKGQGRVPQLDADQFVPKMLELSVKGWRGLTPRKLAKLMRVDLKKLPEGTDIDAEIEYSPEQLTTLMKKSFDLDGFVNESVTNLELFQPDGLEDEKGN
jgi:hypothetical protein